MKSSRVLVLSVLVFILSVGLTACGNSPAATTDQSTGEQQASTQATAPKQEVVEQKAVAPDTAANVDDLVGNWVDITSPDRFVTITKNGTDYQYEDNEGKLPATFKDGVLKLQVSEDPADTADVYIDAKTGHLLSVYKDNISEYAKKQ